MKPPAERVHFAVSPDPLTEHSTVTVLCGVEIAHAQWASTGDSEFVSIEDFIYQHFRRCRECSDKATFAQGRYLYGVRSGQQISQEETSDECTTTASH